MLIKGKPIANKKLALIKKKIKSAKLSIQLDILYIEKNPASELFIQKKSEAAKKLGISVFVHEFEKPTPEIIRAACIRLNKDPNITGYFMQLPIGDLEPKQDILNYVSYQKDVDCLGSIRLGYAATYPNARIRPATVQGIIAMLQSVKFRPKSKKVTIVNDSNLIGKPLAQYLLMHGATVTVCNEFTKDLSIHTKDADLLVTATGKADLITEDMVNEKCIVIDAGISKVGKKVVGDVDFEKVKKKVKAITPVPGGVGPLTIACLFENLLTLHEERK